jgi:8-oxo-dGTP pyrophosphatase MutT (NUDIX family)
MNREDLLSDLSDYAPGDPREAASLVWMRRFLGAPADPFARQNPEGHITASALVARPDGSAFLLLHHRKLGRWLQPGGHTEPDDASTFDAALREAREETGIAALESPFGRAIFDIDVHPIPPRGGEPAHHHFDVRYLFTTEAGIDLAAAEDAGRPMEWRSFEAALASGVDASLTRALEKARMVLAPSLKGERT